MDRKDARSEDRDFGKSRSSLKEVLLFIRYSGDKDKLKEVLDADGVDVLNACVGARTAVKEGEEAVDVCLAIEQMKEKAARQAAQKAAQQERISTLQQSIKNLMGNLGLTAEQAMKALGISETFI